jgi:hypothetical protein
MKYLLSFKLFESVDSLEYGDGINNLKIVGPVDYYIYKGEQVKFNEYQIQAINENGKVVGFSQLYGWDNKCWYSDVLSVSKKYREDINYKNLAVILRLISHSSTGRLTVQSKGFSKSGEAFMRKWESRGYWTFDIDKMTATLTEMGKKASEELAKEFLGINKIDWK